jgi:hypothetical protein
LYMFIRHSDPAAAVAAAERVLDDEVPRRRLVPVPDRAEGAAARIVARLAGDGDGAAEDVHSARLAA